MSAAAMLVALVVESAVGWPEAIHRRIGHPVVWLGALIGALDRRLNRGDRPEPMRVALGAVATVAVVGVAVAAGALVEAALPGGWVGALVAGLLAASLVAARSLHDHVAPVAAALSAGDLDEARRAVGRIVGRDPALLDESGVGRAALESLAENASDGVVAPLFWGALLGLPGIAGYKAINTLDSMIGHRTPRHAAFGRAAARLDDLANLAPARLTALAIAAAGPAPKRALRVALRDARRHRSPNAGWPEAAMAGALGVRLSGPRVYVGRLADEPWLNPDARDPTPEDLRRGLAIHRRAMALVGAALALAASLTW